MSLDSLRWDSIIEAFSITATTTEYITRNSSFSVVVRADFYGFLRFVRLLDATMSLSIAIWEVVKTVDKDGLVEYYFYFYKTTDKDDTCKPRGRYLPPNGKLLSLEKATDMIPPHHLTSMVKDFLKEFGGVGPNSRGIIPQPCSMADLFDIQKQIQYFNVD